MRTWWVVLIAASCGPSSSTPTSKPKTAEDYQREYEAKQVKENEEKCHDGQSYMCSLWAQHFLDTEPKDPAKAKQILSDACGDTKNVKDNDPKAGCQELFNKKLITDQDEAAALCKTKPIACDAVTLSKVLDETHAWQLCTEELAGCHFIQGQVTVDPEHTKEATFLGAVYQYDDMVVQAGMDAIANGAMDDDKPDTACHKDTDCKGERICQAGSCVDAPAKGAKPPPKPAIAKLGVAECDELIEVAMNAHPACPRAEKLVHDLQAWVAYLPLPWKDIPKDRRPAMAPRCKQAGDGVAGIIEEICK